MYVPAMTVVPGRHKALMANWQSKDCKLDILERSTTDLNNAEDHTGVKSLDKHFSPAFTSVSR